MRWSAALGILLVLGACDSENVHWKIVSNPSGSGPHSQGGIIVIVDSSSSATAPPSDWILQPGDLQVDGETVQAWLITEVPGNQDEDAQETEDMVDGPRRSPSQLETSR